MTCLLAIAPSSYHYHHDRLAIDKYAGLRVRVAEAFAASKGRYGYRSVKAIPSKPENGCVIISKKTSSVPL